MKTYILAGLAAGALIVMSSPASAADAAHGQQVFREQCGVCHQGGEGDGDGGQGPSLRGVIGRKVGGDTNFAYTQTLSDDKGIWSTETLSVFLTNPQKAKPGTAMPISIPDDKDRADIIAYLATVK